MLMVIMVVDIVVQAVVQAVVLEAVLGLVEAVALVAPEVVRDVDHHVVVVARVHVQLVAWADAVVQLPIINGAQVLGNCRSHIGFLSILTCHRVFRNM